MFNLYRTPVESFNPYFIGLPILMNIHLIKSAHLKGFNPYFIGLPILILRDLLLTEEKTEVSILILLDYLFLFPIFLMVTLFFWSCFNPYFIGLPILIMQQSLNRKMDRLEVSILILLDYLFLWSTLSFVVTVPIKRFQSLFYWITYSYTS